ncbi:hypothetical protein BDV97DRAFT_200627 [Delphinella strobiligena]|nr:hypothetical protein BDV97DRAFT_200627 [Delphinella strobiligena]
MRRNVAWPIGTRVKGLGAPPPASTLTAAMLRRDRTCIVSKFRDCVERAHLCPRSEVNWFDVNGMSQYNLNRQLVQDTVVDDISNAVALRPDLHTTFDAKRFVFVPKKGKWVVHFTDLTSDLGRLYHNTSLVLHQDVSSRCLLVRFAWAIFPSVMKFLATGAGRVVRMRTVVDNELTEVTRKIGVDETRSKFEIVRSRSTSPKKRKGVITANQPNDAEFWSSHRAKRRRKLCEVTSDDPCCIAASGSRSESQSLANTSPETPQTPPSACSAQSRHNHKAQHYIQEIEQLKRTWLLNQRPASRTLYCCDYSAAEAAVKAGISGKKEWGGSHLCEECLGVEYRSEGEDND